MLANLEQLKLSLMLPQFLRGALETLFNKLISHTAHSETYLRKLDNKTLKVNIQKLDFSLCFIFSAKRLEILGDYEGETDCSVTLAPNLLFKMPKKSELSQFINDQSIQLQGDLQVLQDFVALLEFVEKDPAEFLSPYVGDVVAQGTINFLNKLKQILQFQLSQSQQFWGERLTEEWQVLSPRLAMENFYVEVEKLKQDTEKLEQKIQQLSQ